MRFARHHLIISALALTLALPFSARGQERAGSRLDGAKSAKAARAGSDGRPLWPGSRFSEGERLRAARRGMRFIYATALDESNFEEYGSDYLWCFYTVGSSVRDPVLRRMALRMGFEQARRWRRTRGPLPEGADANTVADYAFGGDAADSLGVRDPRLKDEIRRAAALFRAADFMLFDPRTEAPPSDVPDACEFDRAQHERGAKLCRRCHRPLKMRTPQDVWYDALITAYVGERYGVPLGASYGEVLRWLPALRPYRPVSESDGSEFYDTVYAVTHVVYTLNDYGLYRLPPRELPDEFEFLKANLREAIRQGDADMLGEFMDSLRAFGLTEDDPEIRAGVEYLLTHQNADGSWGDREEEDIYLRYHPTWNAVAALSQYTWRGTAPRVSRYRRILKAEAVKPFVSD